VDLPACTDLQRRTWLALRDIPAGETRSYGWLAKQMGVPGRARAIGAMMGQNPIPLWLPCHRVVASDGTLHGFGGGLAMKRELLELEQALPAPLPLG
jgi:methylated-DNA-[protein]-cysteine S-methyltransferase